MFKHKISKEEVAEMPTVIFEGEITLVDTEQSIKKALEYLRKFDMVGIDTETKPSFAKGKRNAVALLQVSTLERCFLFRLCQTGLTPEIFDFLSDEKVTKIGLSLKDDFSGLYRRTKKQPRNFIDIQNIINNYGILELSLQKIFAILFGKRISKTQRLTNWENDTLTALQQRYAATDAWACLVIYNRLQNEKRLTESEINVIKAEIQTT